MCIFGANLTVDEDWWVGPIRDNVDYFHTTKFSSFWQRFKNYCANTVFKWPMVKWNPPIFYFRRQDYDDDGNFDPLLLNPGHVDFKYADFNRDRRILMEIYLRTMGLFLEEYQILEGIIKLGRAINDDDYSELYEPIKINRQFISPFEEIDHQTIAINRLFRIVRSFDTEYTYEERVKELSSLTNKRKAGLAREASLRTMASAIRSKVQMLEKIADQAESEKEFNVRRVERFLEKKGIMRASKKSSNEDPHQEEEDVENEGSDDGHADAGAADSDAHADTVGGGGSGGIFSFLGWFRKNDVSEIREKGSKRSKLKGKIKTKSKLTTRSRRKRRTRSLRASDAKSTEDQDHDEIEDDEDFKLEKQHGTEYSALNINSEMASLEKDLKKHHELSMRQSRYENILQKERISREIQTKYEEVSKDYKKMVYDRDEVEGRHKIKVMKEIRKFFKKHFTAKHKSEAKNLDYIAKQNIIVELPPVDEDIPKNDENISITNIPKSDEDKEIEELFITKSPLEVLGSTSRLSLTSENIMPEESVLESPKIHEDAALIQLLIEEKKKILEIKQFKRWILRKMGQYRRDENDFNSQIDRSEHGLELLRKKELELKMSMEIEETVEAVYIPPWMKWFVKKRELGLDDSNSLEKLSANKQEDNGQITSMLQYGANGRIIEKVAPHKKVISFEKIRRETGIVRVKHADYPSISPRHLGNYLSWKGSRNFLNKGKGSSGKGASLKSKSSGGSNVVVKKSIFKSGQYGYAVGSKVIKTIYCRSKSFGGSKSSISDGSLNMNFNSDSDSDDSDDEYIDEILEHMEFEFEWPKTLDNIHFNSDKPEYIPLVFDLEDPPKSMDEWRNEPEIDNYIVEASDQPVLRYSAEEIRAELYRRVKTHTERCLRNRMNAINDINRVVNLTLVWRTSFDQLFHGIIPLFDPYVKRSHVHGYIYMERFPIFTTEELYFLYKLFNRKDKLEVDAIRFKDLAYILYRFGDRTSQKIIWYHFITIIRCTKRHVKLIGFEETLEIASNLALGKYDEAETLYDRYHMAVRRLLRLADLHPKLLMTQDCF